MAVQRRLAAILAADVVGYSRLMGEDEEGTLATLTAHLTELIEPCIAEHRGRADFDCADADGGFGSTTAVQRPMICVRFTFNNGSQPPNVRAWDQSDESRGRQISLGEPAVDCGEEGGNLFRPAISELEAV